MGKKKGKGHRSVRTGIDVLARLPVMKTESLTDEPTSRGSPPLSWTAAPQIQLQRLATVTKREVK